MPGKKQPSHTSRKRNAPSNAPSPVFLTLTLVPLIIGVILIGAWALDIAWLEDLQSQLYVGILFLLVSFTATNALLRRWRLATGWGFLLVADVVLLAWLQVWAQVVALALAAIGVGLLAVEFYRQYRENRAQR